MDFEKMNESNTRIMVPWRRVEDAKCPKGCNESKHLALAICPHGFCNRDIGPCHIGHVGSKDKAPAECGILDPWCVATCIEWFQDHPLWFHEYRLTFVEGHCLVMRIGKDSHPFAIRVGHVIAAALAVRLTVSHIHGTLVWPNPSAWIGPRMMPTCVFCGRSVAKARGTMVITWRYAETESGRVQVVTHAGVACNGGHGCSHHPGFPPCTLSRDCNSVDAAMAFLAEYTFMMWTVAQVDDFERAAGELARAR